VGSESRAYREEIRPHSLDRAIAELAARQYGVVSTRQLMALGAAKDSIGRRAAAGHLHRICRGVYAVGHPAITWDARCLAEVMACGLSAILSHRAAAKRWLLVRGAHAIEVTAGRGCKARPGVILHSSRSLAPEDRTVLDAIPITTVARTLVDLAEVLTEPRLADAVHQAEFHRVLDLKEIEGALARVPGRTGRHKLRRVLTAHAPEPPRARNEAERLVLALYERSGLAAPQVNASIDGYEVDAYWPEARLVVELDGRAAHLTGRAFHEDRRRDRVLAAKGIQVLRITWRDLEEDADRLASELLEVYKRRAAAATRT
jgi:very-short-patch-repair endonuclease